MRAHDRRLLPLYVTAAAATLAFTGACHSTINDGPYPTCDGLGCEPMPPTQNESVFTSEVAPPPISGGTLLVTRDGASAVVSDPDRDRVLVVDLQNKTVRGWFYTARGAEPGRAAEDGRGRAFVALRTTGEVVSVDLATGQPIGSTHVCPAPRGVAFDGATDTLHVACAGGELVSFHARSRALTPSRKLHVGDDLRDVVVRGDHLVVSHFRSAAIDTLDAKGEIVNRAIPPNYGAPGSSFSPTVAWRLIGMPDGGTMVIHQQAKNDPIEVPTSAQLPSTSTGGDSSGSGTFDASPGGSAYGGFDCTTGIVHSQATRVDADGNVEVTFGGGLSNMPLPVDIAVSPVDERVAIVAAGNGQVLEAGPGFELQDGCQGGFPGPMAVPANGGAFNLDGVSRMMPSSNEPVAAAYEPSGALVVQIREPASLEIHDVASGVIAATIPLGGGSRLDSAHQLFHSNPEDRANVVVTCASCHPEGRDDGHVWRFTGVGPRRTMSLASFSTETAPFHWSGDLADVGAVMDNVFVGRMGGQPQSDERKAAITAWMTQMPAAPRSSFVDATQAERGRALFEDPSVGCATCHSGPHLTNNATVAVGTGEALQVPGLLGIGARAPYMHDGCAPTLRDRFTSPTCGGGDAHGHTSQLSSAQIDDLVAYLSSL